MKRKAADGGEKGKRLIREGEKGKKMVAEGEREKEKVLVDAEKGKKKATMEGDKSKRKAVYEETEDKGSGIPKTSQRSNDVHNYMDDDEEGDDNVDVEDEGDHVGDNHSDDIIDNVIDDGNDGDDDGEMLRKSKYDEAEALTDEMEEEILLKCDMIAIKESLLDSYKVCTAPHIKEGFDHIVSFDPFIISVARR